MACAAADGNLREGHAQSKVWGTIYNPQENNSLTHVQSMREAAQRLGLT